MEISSILRGVLNFFAGVRKKKRHETKTTSFISRILINSCEFVENWLRTEMKTKMNKRKKIFRQKAGIKQNDEGKSKDE